MNRSCILIVVCCFESAVVLTSCLRTRWAALLIGASFKTILFHEEQWLLVSAKPGKQACSNVTFMFFNVCILVYSCALTFIIFAIWSCEQNNEILSSPDVFLYETCRPLEISSAKQTSLFLMSFWKFLKWESHVKLGSVVTSLHFPKRRIANAKLWS